MTDSNHVQPQQRTTLLAAVGWRLFPDPSLVAQLCHRLPAKVADHWGKCRPSAAPGRSY